MSFKLNHPKNARHSGDVFDAMAAIREEGALEALVATLGEERAQCAAESHSLPVYVSALQLEPRTR